MPQAPVSGSAPRAFDFGDLGRPRPPSTRTLPPESVPVAPPSELELGADDILESDEIEPMDPVTSEFKSVTAPASEGMAAQNPTGFEVGERGTFENIQVEVQTPPPAAAPMPAPVAAAAEAAPVAAAPVVAPGPAFIAELAPVAAAPVVAPGPAFIAELAPVASAPVAAPASVAQPAPVADAPVFDAVAAVLERSAADRAVIVTNAEPVAVHPERTLEMKGGLAAIAEAARTLDAPQETEVLSRSAMPALLQRPYAAPAPSSLAQTAPAWQDRATSSGHMASHARTHQPDAHGFRPAAHPSSIAPVALSPGAHGAGTQSVIHPPPSSGLSGFAIAGIAFAAVALVALVGAGGYVASRTLSDSSEPAPSTESPARAAAATPEPAVASEPAQAPSAAGIDVSSLPSAPAGRGGPRAFAGAAKGASGTGGQGTTLGAPGGPPPPLPHGAAAAPPPPPHGAAAAPPPPGGGARGLTASSNTSSNTSNAAGPAPLPPPAAAVAAPKGASSTGVVRVDPSLRAIVVDGSYRRVDDGAVALSCGKHKIKAGMKEVQTVDVPCGGAVSL